ncbi:MAG: membrane protein insertion efficiency factor YidD [Alphaproteobacteria bacterium]|nr:membrane protein insertion efficiency factor YidD [Alphaproteobacteria bacterium]
MGAAARILRTAIRGYQLFLSPFTAGSCRFAPSCSQYAMEAIERHGPVKGSWLTAHRVCRCNPWGGSGFDPVPPNVSGCDHATTTKNNSNIRVTAR